MPNLQGGYDGNKSDRQLVVFVYEWAVNYLPENIAIQIRALELVTDRILCRTGDLLEVIVLRLLGPLTT